MILKTTPRAHLAFLWALLGLASEHCRVQDTSNGIFGTQTQIRGNLFIILLFLMCFHINKTEEFDNQAKEWIKTAYNSTKE